MLVCRKKTIDEKEILDVPKLLFPGWTLLSLFSKGGLVSQFLAYSFLYSVCFLIRWLQVVTYSKTLIASGTLMPKICMYMHVDTTAICTPHFKLQEHDMDAFLSGHATYTSKGISPYGRRANNRYHQVMKELTRSQCPRSSNSRNTVHPSIHPFM